MSHTGHRGGNAERPKTADPLETMVKGEQLLERAKAVSRQIVDACRRVAPVDTETDGVPLQTPQD
jgi:hypothetical protein